MMSGCERRAIEANVLRAGETPLRPGNTLMKLRTIFLSGLVALACAASALAADGASLTIHADQLGNPVSPLLYGIFFEEINRAGDGGVYAEMIRNRSFEDADTPEGWSLVKADGADGRMALDRAQPPNPQNPTALRLEILAASPSARVGVANEGFQGVGVSAGASYAVAFAARRHEAFDGELRVSIERKDGTVLAEQSIGDLGTGWARFACILTAAETDHAASLVLSTTSKGTVWLDMVSLFPKETYKGHGLRQDLMELLAAMKPAFVRFPGGCYVEGDEIKNAFRWKKTIGGIAERPGHWNLWGYRSTDGLGYHEYLQMCEDLGAEPLFVINCGMAHKNVVPMDKMQEYVQDALDAIEYANGGLETKWGARRARNGHPAPFNVKYLEIGNENGGAAYNERYALFHDALRAKYPHVRLVANVWGGTPQSRGADIVDEHYYNSPQYFMGQARRYDAYDRKGPKVYVGEYACTKECGLGNLMAAVGEAAFMTGMERNGDHVVMSSYAPLLCHPGWKRWNPNAIVFDPARAYGTPSYQVQALFARNRADVNLPLDIAAPPQKLPSRAGRIGVGTWATQAEFKDIRVEKDGTTIFATDFTNGLAGWKTLGGKWEAANGILRQTSGEANARAVAGEASWTDCTLRLKARKLGGSEGFLILFQSQGDKDKSWWNIGGWGNTLHGIEAPGVEDPQVPGSIVTGRWYDVRVDLTGSVVRCYLDGKLVHDLKRSAPDSLYAVAGRDEKTGEIVLKAVNASDRDLETTVSLGGAGSVRPEAEGWVIASDDPADENSFDDPEKVAPVAIRVPVADAGFTHIFPAHSVTVLRIAPR
jgi:alpha-L-arabinofuranosidase